MPQEKGAPDRTLAGTPAADYFWWLTDAPADPLTRILALG